MHTRRTVIKTAAALTATPVAISTTGRSKSEDALKIANDDSEATLKPDDFDGRTYVSSFKRGNRSEIDVSHEFGGYTPDGERLSHVETVAKTPLTGDGWEGYRLKREFRFGDGPALQFETTTRMPPADPILITDLEISITGDTPVEIARPDTHIHEGWVLSQIPPLTDPTGDAQYHVDGHGTHHFDGEDLWRAHDLVGDEQYVTHFGDERALTLSYLDGPTDPVAVVTETTESVDGKSDLPHSEENFPARKAQGFNIDRLDICVGSTTIEPSETATFTHALSLHEGGDDAANHAADITDLAANLATEAPSLEPATSGDDSDTSDDNISGFGIGGAITSLGGAAYVLKSRLDRKMASE